jgi:ubiquinone/menaquinone biosynthesis C-methylase UbiE
MLPRTLEPEVMDSPEEARDYDSMDHAAVNSAFVSDFLAVWDGGNPIIDVGTGTAQIPIELCRRDVRPKIYAVDAAASMLDLARSNVARADLIERFQIEQADAKRLPARDATCGAVISNSIVHHIPEPAAVLSEMVRVLKPGGRIFVRDLMRPASGATLVCLVNRYADGANDHQRAMFADSLRAALTLEEIQDLVAAHGMDPAGVQATSDRHWTWSAVK